MRLFPRTASRRLAAATIACALAAGAVSVPFANAEDLKDKQKQVQRQIKGARADVDLSSQRLRNATLRLNAARADLDEARDDLAAARAKLVAARIRDREMQEKLDAAEERLSAAEQDLVEGRAALEVQRDAVVDVINETYQGGNPQLLAFASMLNAETSSDLTRRDEVRDVIVGKETQAYDDLRAGEVLLEVRQDEVEDARDEVEVQREAAADHLVTMTELTEGARAAKTRVVDLVRDRRDARADAVRARERDRHLLARLERQEERIKRKILAAAQRAARRSSGGYRGTTDGFLNRPVVGTVSSPFGYRRHPIYGYWSLHDGQDIAAPCGAPLYAAASGRVLSRYYSPVWGQRLFLSLGQVNGKNLTVVYNHSARYTVSPGQQVERGQVVGYVGNTGWSTGCHVHFTVMANAVPVNPDNWF